jgi:uncharacterized protein (DUF2249 family)
MTTYVDLDVRPVLRNGGEPFEEIMKTVNNLQPGQGLRLFETFKPTTLLHVLGSKVYTHKEKELADGEWEVEFTPTGAAAQTAAVSPQQDDTPWPEPVQHMDNRDLDPPEPMEKILAATQAMAPGEVLCALLRREPLFLFPELAKRGHKWRGDFEADHKAYKILIRVGDKAQAAA